MSRNIVLDNIYKKINKNGYLYIDEFMGIVLSDYKESYYRSRNPIGNSGDFVTSPEITQVFGEIIGVYCAYKWIQNLRPVNFHLIEVGAGTGELIIDIYRATKHIKGFHKALKIHLYEVSEYLKIIQKQKFKNNSIQVNYLSSLSDLTNIKGVLIANEFFDALPIKQYIKCDLNWNERVVQLNNGELEFSYKSISKDINTKINNKYVNAKNGAVVELFQGRNYIKDIAKMLKSGLSSALIIDYGYFIDPSIRNNEQYKTTLQSIKSGKYISLFENIGNADISSHVDFYDIKEILNSYGIKNILVSSMNEFLAKYGIDDRFKMLISKADLKGKILLTKQYSRIMSIQRMGALFKVLEAIK